MKIDFRHEAQEISEEIVGWRRDLHKIPEIGLVLPQTVRYVKERLEEMGIAYRTYEGHSGITVDIGRGGGRAIAIRADMDGLPMREETGLPFTSTNENMHACGHDAHTAILLGTAKMLKSHEEMIPGLVRLIFQPGEEFPGGAEPMVKDGVLENPKMDYILALHVSNKGNDYINGDVVVSYENTSASDEQLYLTIKGKGGHGASPDLCIDPIAIATLVINNLQYIISREVSPFNSSVLTIATVRAGNGANNIIPDTAEVIGTVRNVDLESRNYVITRIREIVDHTVKAMRGDYDLEFKYPYPPLVNDRRVVERFLDVAGRVLGEGHTHIMTRPEMGGEDAAFFFQKVPGCYFYLQCPMKSEIDGRAYGVHNSRFRLDETVLFLGAALFAETAFELLEDEAG
ncbi:M20 family metallopeptidase [uncultured Clostridium sp.]|uniref:M20 metallopeptidase family protein n=1 Tax=uncultured Clostridium sp. TaxID=59620 RepID=UPI0025EAC0EF|nr:M20 family metallopeptidase [uncultured Clostridium sp.]